MAVSPSVGLVVVGLAAAFLVKYLIAKRHAHPLPPGPKGFPLVGNITDLPPPGELECQYWAKFKDLYGPISSITVLGQTFIILNDAEIANALLVQRSNIYSNRPYMPFAVKLAGWYQTLGFSNDTPVFKMHRKNIAQAIGSNATLASVCSRVQEEEACRFLVNLLDSPKNLFSHIKQEAGAVILKITYGYTVDPCGNDPLVSMAGKAMEDFSEAATPGKWAVDILPILEHVPAWFPGAGFQKTARRMATHINRTTEQPYQLVKQRMRENTQPPSFLSQAIKGAASPEEENVSKWSASSMYLGGADTTVGVLMTFFLAMMVYPDVQKKAQEELDRVLGGRMPVSSDRNSLPYIDAVLKETHRWHPVGPTAIPHTTAREDVYDGYRIPKGALVIPNTWLFTHDPAVYKDPMVFNPDRYLSSNPEPDPRRWAYGYGRRACPGRELAENALYLTMAQVLSVFDISKPVENGKVIEPEVRFEAGAVSHPLPYQADIKPRSKEHERRIKDEEKKWPPVKSDREELEKIGFE